MTEDESPIKITIEFETEIVTLDREDAQEFLSLFRSLIRTTEDATNYLFLLNYNKHTKDVNF